MSTHIHKTHIKHTFTSHIVLCVIVFGKLFIQTKSAVDTGIFLANSQSFLVHSFPIEKNEK